MKHPVRRPILAGLAFATGMGTLILPAWSQAPAVPKVPLTARPADCQPARFALGGPAFCLQTDRSTNSQALTLHIYQAVSTKAYRLSDTLTIEDWYGNGTARVVKPGPGQADLIIARGTGIRGTGVSQTLVYLISYRNGRFAPVLLETLAHTLDEPQGKDGFEGSLSLQLLGKLRISTRHGQPLARVDYRFTGNFQPDSETAPKARSRHQRSEWHDELPYCPATASFYGCAPETRAKPTDIARTAIHEARRQFITQRPTLYPNPTPEPANESPAMMWGILDNITDYPGLISRAR